MGQLKMAIVLTCPECDQKLKVAEKLEGKRIRCPKCGNLLTVPAPDGLEESSAPVSRPTPRNANGLSAETLDSHAEGDRPQRLKKQLRSRSQQGNRSHFWLLIAGGGTLLLLLGLATIGSFFWFFRGSKTDSAAEKAGTTGTTSRHVGKDRVYVKEAGFSVVLPSGWQTKVDPSSSPFLTSDGPNKQGTVPYFNVRFKTNGSSSVDEIAKKMKKELPEIVREWKLIEEGYVTIDGKRAYFCLSRSGDRAPMVLTYYILGNNGKVYNLVWTTEVGVFDQYRTLYEQSALSVHTD